MKTLTIISIVSAVLVAIVIGIKSNEVQANNKAIFTPTDEINTGKVLRIRYCTLKQGVEPQEFERFMAEEFNPLMNEIMPGIRIIVMKGERGPNVGQYIVVWEMNSLYVRNYYMPEPGEYSEAFKTIGENCGEPCDQLQTRFKELAERTNFTDYVSIVKK